MTGQRRMVSLVNVRRISRDGALSRYLQYNMESRTEELEVSRLKSTIQKSLEQQESAVVAGEARDR